MAATDERAIHEFPTGTIDDNSLLIMDRPTATPGEYETEKFAIANLGLKLLGGIDFPNNLDTDEQDIFGAINEVNAKAMNIAAEYDETDSYSKGDYCIYQNATYRCIKASGTTTGTFVAADWTQIKVLTEVKSNSEAISQNAQAIATKQDILADESKNVTINISIAGGGASARIYGKILMLSMVVKPQSNVNSNTTIATISGVTIAQDIYASVISSGGDYGRLKIAAGTNTVVNESLLKNTDYYSMTLMGIIS